MPGIQPISFSTDDLKEHSLSVFNDWVSKVVTELNRLGGQLGPVSMGHDMDMQGHSIVNVGAPTDAKIAATAALTPTAAQPQFGPAAIKTQVEATGQQILQTTRRLNDRVQQENYSTFLNATGSTPPASNTATFTRVDATHWRINGGEVDFADGTKKIFATRSDTTSAPSGGNVKVFYYYAAPNTNNDGLQLAFVDPPATADTSANQMKANIDGRIYVGTVVVTSSDVTGGMGGDTGPNRGCTEIGTPLTFPPNCEVQVRIEPCSEWIEVEFEPRETLTLAYGTLLGMFMQADGEEMYAARRNGRMGRVVCRRHIQRESYKQVVTVTPDGTYWAGQGQWLLHNLKPK